MSRTVDAAAKQLGEARAKAPITDVDVVIGTGADWRAAVDDIAWEMGDVLLLRDLPQERRLSMERFADALEHGFRLDPRIGVRAMTLRE